MQLLWTRFRIRRCLLINSIRSYALMKLGVYWVLSNISNLENMHVGTSYSQIFIAVFMVIIPLNSSKKKQSLKKSRENIKTLLRSNSKLRIDSNYLRRKSKRCRERCPECAEEIFFLGNVRKIWSIQITTLKNSSKIQANSN